MSNVEEEVVVEESPQVVVEEVPEEIVTELPEELKVLYDTLYNKINSMIGGRKLTEQSSVRVVKFLIENSMEIVEKFRNEDGNGWTGYEKKEHALSLSKYILENLQKEGKIDNKLADQLLLGLELFGSVAMDLVIDAVKKIFDVGQDVVEDIQTNGCAGCTKRNLNGKCNIM